MGVITGGRVIEGSGLGEPLLNAGAPVNGVNAVQTVTITGTPTGGTFTLTVLNPQTGVAATSAAIAYNAAAAAVQAALEALPNIGTGNVAGAGGALPGTPVTITFQNALGGLVVATMTAAGSLTGGTTPAVAVATTTAGVAGTSRGAPVGARLTDTTIGKLYINTGSAATPTWTVVGSQS